MKLQNKKIIKKLVEKVNESGDTILENPENKNLINYQVMPAKPGLTFKIYTPK